MVTNGNQTPIPVDGLPNLSYDQTSNRINTPGYIYDVAGNMIRGQKPDGSWQWFEYDAAGRLVNIYADAGGNRGGNIQGSGYGASRQRVVTNEGGVLKWYVWGGSSVLAEYTATSWGGTYNWVKSYIYAGSRLLSTFSKNGASEILEFHHPDRLGTKLVTNNAANTFYEQSTLPFGTSLDAEFIGTPTTNQRFTSYDRSTVANLDYAVNRSYSSGQGRFTSVDPIGMSSASRTNPQSNNLYAYVGNNPIDFVDPSGLFKLAPKPQEPDYGALLSLIFGNRPRYIEQPVIDEPGGGGGDGTQQDNPPRSGPCNLHTPKFDQLNSLSGNPAALALLNRTYGNQARLYYNQMTPYNQAVFLNTVAAVNAQSPNLLSSAKFLGFYNGNSGTADAFGISVSGVTEKMLDKEGLREKSIANLGKSRRSPGNINEGSVEATVEGNFVDFDVDLNNPFGDNFDSLAKHFEEVRYNTDHNTTTHPADVVRKLNARGVTTGVSCR